MSIVLQLRRAVSVVFCCQYEGRTAVYEFATAEVLAHQAAALLAHAIATTLHTSQSAPSGNNGQATRTSKEPGNRPPYPGREVPYSGAHIKGGGAFLPLRAIRKAAQRANRKGSNNQDIPRCRARQKDCPAPCTSSCSSTSALKSLTRSPSANSRPTKRTR
uniref:RxLR effector candidate protein n=1 Tax=Hyaloperonospora arabidopsidis (strain Emoy2) TaxID=559515 RepID=M4BIC6_HYAAE